MKWLNEYSIYGFLTALFIFVLPFVTSRHLHFGAINAKYFYVLIAISIFALIFSYLMVTKKIALSFNKRWLLIALGGVFLALFLSTVLGVYPERSLYSDVIRSTGVFFLLYIGFLAIWTGYLLHERDWSLLRWSVTISGAIVGFLTFLGGEGLHISGRFLTTNLDIHGLTLGNSTFGGAYLFIAFVLTLSEWFRTKNRKARYLLSGLLLLQGISPMLLNIQILIGNVSFSELMNPFVWLGTARASSAAFFAVIIYVLGLLLIRKFITVRPAVNLAWAGVWLAGIVLALGFLFTPGSVVQEKYIEESTAARIILWESAFETFQERPLFGWGPENFRIGVEHHFDNRLYQQENLGEIWFDRAHNLFLDTLVTVGVVGFAAGATLVLCFIWVVIHACRRGLIGVVEANLLGALMVGHIVQLQTGFDTVATYTLIAVVLGYGLWLEREMVPVVPILPKLQKIGAGVFAALILIASLPLIFAEYARQDSLYRIFVTTNSQEQSEHIEVALSRQSSIESLRFASSSLTKGLFANLADKGEQINPTLISQAIEQLALFGEHWKSYVAAHPQDYRARMNYAYNLLLQTTFGRDHLEEAKAVIVDSYQYSPENPLTFVLDGVAELYSGNLAGAREKIEAAVAVNPNAEFSQEILMYLERQESSFPEVTILQLGNL